MAIEMFNFLLSHISISCGRCVYDPDYFIFIISMKWTFFFSGTALRHKEEIVKELRLTLEAGTNLQLKMAFSGSPKVN